MILDLTPAQDAFRRSAEAFAREVVAPCAQVIDESGEFPVEIVQAAAGRGLCGMTIPRSLGGLGLDHLSYVLAIEAIARVSAAVAASLSATNSLVAEIIAGAGSAAQRDRWLRPLVAGTVTGAFALSEPEAGTDAANQRTSATTTSARSASANKSSTTSPDRYRLTGRKVWVANAEVASIAIVFAATRLEVRGGPGAPRQGITAFVVPLDGPGVWRTPRRDSLGVRGLGCADLELDVEVQSDQVLGCVDEGFALAMYALQGGRVAVAAQALGIGQAALDEAIVHATHRETFGQPLANHQAIQWMIADAATKLDAARLLTYKAAALTPPLPDPLPELPDPPDLPGLPRRPDFQASMAKLAASQAARAATEATMQILASAAYRRGSTVERLVRDARATEIDEGTSETQRMIIAAGILGPLDGPDRT